MGIYYIELDIHKKIITHCVKLKSGQLGLQGTVTAIRDALPARLLTIPGPWVAKSWSWSDCDDERPEEPSYRWREMDFGWARSNPSAISSGFHF